METHAFHSWEIWVRYCSIALLINSRKKMRLVLFCCRSFFTPRKPVLLSNLGEVPLARWLLCDCLYLLSTSYVFHANRVGVGCLPIWLVLVNSILLLWLFMWGRFMYLVARRNSGFFWQMDPKAVQNYRLKNFMIVFLLLASAHLSMIMIHLDHSANALQGPQYVNVCFTVNFIQFYD